MKDILSFVKFLFLISIGQICSWLQLNLQFIDSRFVNNYWLLLTGIPVTWIYIQSTKWGAQSFDGQLWPQRLIGFSIGIIIYTLMTYYFFSEKLELKNLICLGLGFLIVLIQVLWK